MMQSPTDIKVLDNVYLDTRDKNADEKKTKRVDQEPLLDNNRNEAKFIDLGLKLDNITIVVSNTKIYVMELISKMTITNDYMKESRNNSSKSTRLSWIQCGLSIGVGVLMTVVTLLIPQARVKFARLLQIRDNNFNPNENNQTDDVENMVGDTPDIPQGRRPIAQIRESLEVRNRRLERIDTVRNLRRRISAKGAQTKRVSI